MIALFGTALGNDATEVIADVSGSVRVTIDEKPATVTFAGSVPGLTGLNQINVVLPAGLSTGEHRLRAARNSATSNEVTITIR